MPNACVCFAGKQTLDIIIIYSKGYYPSCQAKSRGVFLRGGLENTLMVLSFQIVNFIQNILELALKLFKNNLFLHSFCEFNEGPVNNSQNSVKTRLQPLEVRFSGRIH